MLVGFPESIKDWKEIFFFVKASMLVTNLKWRGPKKVTDHIPDAAKYDAGSVWRISSLMFDIRHLRDPVLHAAALSPFTVDHAGQLMEKRKRKCLVRCKWFAWYLLIVILLTVYVVYFVVLSLQEFIEARSKELQTRENVRVGTMVERRKSQAESTAEEEYHPRGARK